MYEPLSRLAGRDKRSLDLAAAAAIAALCALQLTIRPPRGGGLVIGIAGLTALGCAAMVVRRRVPVTVAVVFAAALFVPGVVLGSRWWNPLPLALLVVCVILSYTLGSRVDGPPAMLGLAAMAVAASAGDLSPSSFVSSLVLTVPGWAAGRVIRSRNRLAVQLAARARELELEREAFAREAVRYERARIARDLHDIVAHSVSMIVLQAGAGRRALATQPATAAESLEHIQRGAHQAELEIEELAALLADHPPRAGDRGLGPLDQLVQRAAATGLSVTCKFTGNHDNLPAEITDAAYRVTQEGITNALKHAPGAPITVEVHASSTGLWITVENGPPSGPGSGLDKAGGGYGIAGLSDRLRCVEGTLQAGQTPTGGWRLAARLPRASTAC
jgi:signal transduction histidine kinase